MKKSILLSIVIVALLFSACSGGETKISAEKAKEIALQNAGISAEDATFVKTEKEREDGKTIYEVEFYSKDNMEYDYEIDANTGDILSYDTDAENYNGASQNNQNTQTDSAASTAQITEKKAKEIALAKVSGATENDIREFKKDHDDGKYVYEGKIIYNNTEYDFEIDAQTGNVIKWEHEPANR